MSADNNTVLISAASGTGLEKLVSRIEELVLDGKTTEIFYIPNAKQGILSKMYGYMTINDVDYGAEGITVTAVADKRARGMFEEFMLNKPQKSEDDIWE